MLISVRARKSKVDEISVVNLLSYKINVLATFTFEKFVAIE